MSDTTQFVKVAGVAEIPPGEVRVFSAHGHRIALCNNDGQYYAIDDRCTHDNGPLGEGELVDGEIECPRHGARFDIKTGKAMCLPAVGSVATYPIEIRDGELWVGPPSK
ncbi:MAG: non-heme iron oxygenase ferredoxin subunit [Candidatus Obscuribacterales bacterium]|jgi:3-phenylpropionate/trans-cinnamate dioxygenase ferredoxin subunit